jgi:AraC family ethanolamine operon transcriptional activator
MATASPPAILLDQYFTDLNEYARLVGWDIEFRQLDAGAPRSRAAVMGTTSCVVLRGEYDRAYHQAGQMPDDTFVLGLPDPGVEDFRWCRKNASGGEIVNFSLGSGFDGTCGAGFSGFAISFHDDLLQQTCQTLELDFDYRHVLNQFEILPQSQNVAKALRLQLLAAFGSAMFSDNSEAVEFFNFSAAAQLLNFLASNEVEHNRAPLDVRCRAARTALEFLEDQDTLPISVSELCSNIGVSAPTLYRAFQEQFGVSPKQYIQIRRLCGVREQLFANDTGESIADVANNWGFWHMGQFAADYRQHFGELPSQTLAGKK